VPRPEPRSPPAIKLGLVGLARIANRWRPGTISRNNWTRLPAESGDWSERPVTSPPGRARLATKPAATGSPDTAKTIGICGATCFITMESLVDDVTIRSTLSRTNSAAISSSCLGRPAAQRDSIVIVWPSIQPSSRSRCKNAPVLRLGIRGFVGAT
jgi:hypothetical protein